jgi:hypothetical protein
MLNKLNKILVLGLSIFFIGCQKSEVVPLFDKSANVRVAESIKDYKTKLSGAAYGWRGLYYPNGAKDGGYTFYLKFDANGALSMYSDLSLGFSDQAFETSYQVKVLQQPTLIFDTYSYLHELVNPDYNGGDGALADLELTFKSATADKIELKGNKNNTEMVLIKISADEYDQVKKGGLKKTLTNTLGYIFGDKFLYLNGQNNEKADVFIDLNTKIFTAYLVKNNDIQTIYSPFTTSITGIQFKNPIVIFGTTISELIWDDVKKVYYYNSGGNKIALSEGKRPAMSFYDALGTLFTGNTFDPAIKTQSEFFKTLYPKLKDKTIALSITAPLRVIESIEFNYEPQNGVFALITKYSRSYPDGEVARFGGVLFFEPNLDNNGRISFTKYTQTATDLSTGQRVSGISAIVEQGVTELSTFLTSNTFTWDYDDIESKTALLTSTKDSKLFIKGKLF